MLRKRNRKVNTFFFYFQAQYLFFYPSYENERTTHDNLTHPRPSGEWMLLSMLMITL